MPAKKIASKTPTARPRSSSTAAPRVKVDLDPGSNKMPPGPTIAEVEEARIKKRQRVMLEALKKTMGVVQPACEKSGVARATHYGWVQNYPDYAQAVNELREVSIDFAEGKLLQLIDKKNPSATIFFLKTQGRNRGYSERHEIVGANGGPIMSNVTGKLSFDGVSSLNKNQLRSLAKEILADDDEDEEQGEEHADDEEAGS